MHKGICGHFLGQSWMGYGKNKSNNAMVYVLDNVKTLYSYLAPICQIDEDGNFIRIWDGWSLTTSKHINAFRKYYGLNPITKKEWLANEVQK